MIRANAYPLNVLSRIISLISVSCAAGSALSAVDATPVPANFNTIYCHSSAGERQHCDANTVGGVVLLKAVDPAICILGNTWGYDAQGVWVMNGCGGEFLVANSPTDASPAPAASPESKVSAPAVAAGAAAATIVVTDTDSEAQNGEVGAASHGPEEPAVSGVPAQTWGVLDPGKGFLVGRGEQGELSISAYVLLRYMNQGPADQTFTDHLGRERPVDTRQDIYSHRILVWLNGWVADPKLVYTIAFWTVNTTDQDAIFGNIGYRFHKKFNLYGGLNGNPGSRSMQGSHPYWLGNDRVMADEFFRPFFTQGIWANGELLPGFWYNVMVGNTSSTLGVTANQIDRKFGTGASIWWMPTTQEFGPRGAYGDWEMHEEVATRFGLSTTISPEERYTDIGTDPGNTALKLADSVNLFEQGALAPDVTVTFADYRVLALDAGVKYRGFFFQAEIYNRWLNGFEADGALPVDEIVDWGFYMQSAFYPIPKKLELYAATSQIFGDSGAGFSDSSEYLIGMNYYPFNTRNHRLNVQLIDVNRSPVSSTFGYYTGGQDGLTLAVAFSIFF